MKTKFYWFALLASAALIAQAQAGGHHGGGGFAGGGGGHFSSHAGGPSFHSAPHANFGGGGRFAAPGPRFSTMRGLSSSNTFRQHYVNGGAAMGRRQFAAGDFNHGSHMMRFADRGNRPGRIANPAGARTGIQNQSG